jgi:hypothetical protein
MLPMGSSTLKKEKEIRKRENGKERKIASHFAHEKILWTRK